MNIYFPPIYVVFKDGEDISKYFVTRIKPKPNVVDAKKAKEKQSNNDTIFET